MAASIPVYPQRGQTYPDAEGTPVTAAGAIVPESEYIHLALAKGFLLTEDPLGIYTPEDRTVSITADTVDGDELVYDDGEFTANYVGSEYVAGSFTIRRTGGWPEAAPVLSTGLIYSVDFTALPAATFSTAGAHVIDGLTWYRKPGLTATTCEIGAGLGLRASTVFVAEGGSYSSRMFLPFANVPGYNPNLPAAIQWRAYDTGVAGPIAIVGIADYEADGGAPSATPSAHAARRGLAWNGSTAAASTGSGLNLWNGATQNSAGLGATRAPQDTGLGFYVCSPRTLQVSGFLWSSAPNPYTGALDPTTATTAQDLVNTTYSWNMAKLGIYIAHNGQPGAYVRQLKIWQPVAA